MNPIFIILQSHKPRHKTQIRQTSKKNTPTEEKPTTTSNQPANTKHYELFMLLHCHQY